MQILSSVKVGRVNPRPEPDTRGITTQKMGSGPVGGGGGGGGEGGRTVGYHCLRKWSTLLVLVPITRMYLELGNAWEKWECDRRVTLSPPSNPRNRPWALMGGFYGCCGEGVEKRLRVCFAASLLRCLAVFQIPYLFEETGILTHQQSCIIRADDKGAAAPQRLPIHRDPHQKAQQQGRSS